jgi:xylan 1,4-beta-xylosidase
MGETYFVYFSAKNAKTNNMCLGVGTAKDPMGPYKDHGPLVCEGPGSIDAMPVVDESGEKYLLWKEDGNSQQKPTPIHIQKLDSTGTKLVGEKMDTIVNDAPWESQLVEGPFVMKRGDFWYMFYSGNACCGLQCNYALGVARAKQLTGPWEKNPKNPILKGNDVWKCPGHGSIVQDDKGHDVLVYHAYHAKDSVYVGRQAMADIVVWGEDGWPTINEGRGPSTHANGLLGARLKNEEHRFTEKFDTPKLAASWQWPRQMNPRFVTGKGELVLRGEKKKDPFATVIGHSTTLGDYTASVDVKVAELKGATAGLAAYGESGNSIGANVIGKDVVLIQRIGGKDTELARWLLPNDAETVTLRLQATGGQRFRFSLKSGTDDRVLGSEVSGEKLPPWDLGIRVALTASNGDARFSNFTIEPSK